LPRCAKTRTCLASDSAMMRCGTPAAWFRTGMSIRG
jgi:hypothetical protein